ncbi:MAG: hypothetical protein LBQ71_10745, partial [Hungatella sp.]|nr:hypothetical protein [Hungatella sp.]
LKQRSYRFNNGLAYSDPVHVAPPPKKVFKRGAEFLATFVNRKNTKKSRLFLVIITLFSCQGTSFS